MSTDAIEIVVNGRGLETRAGVSVASALLNANVLEFRRSERGESRAPLCGMGVCYECRVTIDGVAHRRACMTTVAPGMTVETRAAGSEPR